MKIVFRGQDDTVAIMTLTPGADKEETIQKFQNSHPKGFYDEYYETDIELPSSREFRGAWTLKNNKIEVDEKRAMNIHLSRIRYARNQKLEELDKEQLRVLTDVNRMAHIESRKQVLRDLPNNWNNLDWPDIHLGERK